MDFIVEMVFYFIIFIIFATFHEYAHGWMADRCGDPTARQNGRLSLNPLVHIDFFWTILMPAILLITTNGRFALGSAKPVPVNPYQFRNPKRDIIWVGLAGPFANVAWALILIFIMKAGIFSPASPIYFLLFICMWVNIVLLVFNMIPIPPLDGSRVVEGLLPDRYVEQYSRTSSYISFILIIGLMYFGILSRLFLFVLKLVIVIFNLHVPSRWM